MDYEETGSTVLEQDAPGGELVEPAYEDYFGFRDIRQWYFPDGRQHIEFKVMNEGDRKQYQSQTRADLEVVRSTGNARMSMNPAEERHILLGTSITGWHLVQKTPQGVFKPVAFSKQTLSAWLLQADPRIIDQLEKEIRKANPWLMQDMTVADIDKELDSLREMREVAVKREQGEAGSAGK